MAAPRNTINYQKTYRRLAITLWPDKVSSDDWTMPLVPMMNPLPSLLRFAVGQEEICPATQRKHWQLYLELNRPSKLPAVMEMLGMDKKLDKGAWHVEAAAGSPEANIDYCTKEASRAPDGQQFQIGERPGGEQGKRNDLALACKLVAAGGIKRVAMELPATFVKYHKGFQELERQHRVTARDRSIDPIVVVMWGPTGTGKTKRAWDFADKHIGNVYNKDADNKWWDGYLGEQICIVDEIKDQVSLPTLLKWTDRYQLRQEIKGTMTQIAIYYWIFTSNYSPHEWFDKAGLDSRAALQRRITHEFNITELDQVVELPPLQEGIEYLRRLGGNDEPGMCNNTSYGLHRIR